MHRIGALVFAGRGVGDRGERCVDVRQRTRDHNRVRQIVAGAAADRGMEAAAERKLAVLDINRGRERVGGIIAAVGGRYRQPAQQRRDVLRRGAGTGAGVQDRRVGDAGNRNGGGNRGRRQADVAADGHSSVESAVKCTVSVPSYSPVGV